MVKAAIDKTDAPIRAAAAKLQISGQKVFEQKLQPETRAALAAKGYTKEELPLIARAVRGYVMSQNVSEAEAEAVAKRRLRPAERKITEPELFVSRCAAHADELYSLMAKGQLTARSFGFGDPRLKELEDALKANHNAYIAKQVALLQHQPGPVPRPGSHPRYRGHDALR